VISAAKESVDCVGLYVRAMPAALQVRKRFSSDESIERDVMSKAINGFLLVLVTALIVGGTVYWLKPSTKVDVSVTIEQMRKIARLATTEWTMSSFAEKDFYHKTGILPPWKTIQTDYVIARCRGKVTGAVDMEKAQIEVQERRHVSIHFPRGSVVVSDPQIDTLETISARGKIHGEWLVYEGATEAQKKEVEREALEKIKQTAIEEGIAQTTIDNAKTVLGEFVRSLGYEATITFDEPAYSPHGSEALAALPATRGK
jgi:hypothetical protein